MKRISKRASINLVKLDRPFIMVYNTPHSGCSYYSMSAKTQKEADETIGKINRSDSTGLRRYVIDLREALAQPIQRINDSRR